MRFSSSSVDQDDKAARNITSGGVLYRTESLQFPVLRLWHNSCHAVVTGQMIAFYRTVVLHGHELMMQQVPKFVPVSLDPLKAPKGFTPRG
jgi:hypothetical protein